MNIRMVALKIIFCENCPAKWRKVMIVYYEKLYETIIWNILGEGEKRRKMNLSWWTKIGFKKGVDFWLEMKVLNLKESEQMMMMIICFCSIMSVCQFVKSNEHLFYYNCFHVYVNFQPLCFHHAVPLETIEKYQMTTLSFIQQPFVWTFICICCNVTLLRCNKSGTEQKTRRWFGSRLFFVVVTNFEALCFHRNRRVRRRSLSACGFFSSKMKTNLRLLLLLLSLFPYWKGSHEFVRERNSLDLSFYCIAHRLFIRGCKHYKLLTNTSVFEKYPKSLCLNIASEASFVLLRTKKYNF